MIYTEIHTNEYSFIIGMSAAAGSRKFHADIGETRRPKEKE